VKLTVDGKSYTQPIEVKQDPRVKTPALTMSRVYSLTHTTYYGAADALEAADAAASLRAQVVKIQANADGPIKDALGDFEKRLAALEGTRSAPAGGRGGGRGGGPPEQAQPNDTLWRVSEQLSGMMNAMQAADVAPTTNTVNALTAANATAARVMARWTAIRTADVPALNAKLKAAGLPLLELP
jgi:hypothetical protein